MTLIIKATHNDKTVQKWQCDFKSKIMGNTDGDGNWNEKNNFDWILHGKVALIRIKIDRKLGRIDIKANHEQIGYSITESRFSYIDVEFLLFHEQRGLITRHLTE